MIVSDHVPLLLNCCKQTSTKHPPRLEIFWLGYEEAQHIVQTVWMEQGTRVRGASTRFQAKTDEVHKALRHWHLNRFSQTEMQLNNCRKALIFFDTIEEKRALDTREFNFRLKIRARGI